MEACLEALLEIDFCTKSPNFGVEAHMEGPAGDALRIFLKKYLEVQFNYKFVLNIPSAAISQYCVRRYLNIKIFVWLFMLIISIHKI
jgi:hypothetical protein